MKKLSLLSFMLFIFMAGLPGCKKDKKSDQNTSAALQVISDPSMANVSNGLQAYYDKGDDSFQSYFYGNFNSAGVPVAVNQVVVKKKNSTSSLNLFFDEESRPSYLYVSTVGEPNLYYVLFDYNTAGKTIGKLFKHDYTSNTSTLVAQKTMDNASRQLTLLKNSGKIHSAGIGGSLLTLFANVAIQSDIDLYLNGLFLKAVSKIAPYVIPVMAGLAAVAIAGPTAPIWLPIAAASLSTLDLDWIKEILKSLKRNRVPEEVPEPPANPYQNYTQRIIGKWALLSIVYQQGAQKTTQIGSSVDFVQFDANGKFSGNIFATGYGVATSTWEIINNETIKIKSTDEVTFPTSGFQIDYLSYNFLTVHAEKDGIVATYQFEKSGL